jgi:NAD(P) transhydrogenase subunit alpha
MGAKFVELDLESLEGAGGYAREMTDDRAARQRELLTPYIAKSDAVITTAAIPGRAAPLLVTRSMVETMRPGSVVVDLAAESGGNVEGSVAGAEVDIGGVVVWGGKDVPSQMPADASRLYARNVCDLLLLVVSEGDVAPDWDDEVLAGCWVTREGALREGVPA